MGCCTSQPDQRPDVQAAAATIIALASWGMIGYNISGKALFQDSATTGFLPQLKPLICSSFFLRSVIWISLVSKLYETK